MPGKKNRRNKKPSSPSETTVKNIQNGRESSLSGLIAPAFSAMSINRRNVVEEFNRYMGNETIRNWQRLCADIGLEGHFTSITQCKKALAPVWVNIYDFLEARSRDVHPHHFPTEKALSAYTRSNKKVFPKRKAKEGGAARALLAHIF